MRNGQKFLSKNRFLVGLSLDGPRGVNDFCRVTRSGESIFSKEMNTVGWFEEYKVDFNVVSVVTSKTAEKITEIYHFFKDKGFQYMQFIPCLDENIRVHSEYSLTPRHMENFCAGFLTCGMRTSVMVEILIYDYFQTMHRWLPVMHLRNAGCAESVQHILWLKQMGMFIHVISMHVTSGNWVL